MLDRVKRRQRCTKRTAAVSIQRIRVTRAITSPRATSFRGDLNHKRTVPVSTPILFICDYFVVSSYFYISFGKIMKLCYTSSFFIFFELSYARGRRQPPHVVFPLFPSVSFPTYNLVEIIITLLASIFQKLAESPILTDLHSCSLVPYLKPQAN